MKYLYLIPLLLLAACTVGPEYKSPEIDAPDTFAYQEVFELLNKDKKESDQLNQWWEGFSDNGLARLIEQAIENNNQIASAAARLKAARANVRLIDANDAANVNASLDNQVSSNKLLDGNDSGSKNSEYGVGLNLLLPLDVFGKNKRELEAAIAALEAAEAELSDTVLQISTDVAREYLRYRGNQRQLILLRESVVLQEKTLSVITARYKAGLSPELDLRRAETSVERLRADIPPLLQSLSNSRHTLANFIGQYPTYSLPDLDEEKGIPDYEYRLKSAIPIDVLRQRPDIRRAEAELKQAIASIGIAEADFYSSFDLLGSLQVTTGGIIGNTSLDLFTLSLSLLIDQFITDGGARQSRLDIAQARAEELLADYKQALLDGALDVESTLVALQTSIERQSSLEKAVTSSSRSFEQANRLYQLGLSSFLDVVDAQRVLAAAEQQLATERTNYSTQIASLFRVLGTSIAY